jgi:hypothetical protein
MFQRRTAYVSSSSNVQPMVRKVHHTVRKYGNIINDSWYSFDVSYCWNRGKKLFYDTVAGTVLPLLALYVFILFYY